MRKRHHYLIDTLTFRCPRSPIALMLATSSWTEADGLHAHQSKALLSGLQLTTSYMPDDIAPSVGQRLLLSRAAASATQTLAQFIVDIRFDQLPAAAVQAAK